MTAADRWRQQLQAWALPPDLLASAPQSPYGWPKKTWKDRAKRALDQELSPTGDLVHRLAGNRGSVLDIGAGSGRSSLPLVREGHRVTMVEPDPTMLETLTELTVAHPVAIVAGRWPEVADQVESHTVAMSTHVVYDVPELVPFLKAMDRKAESAVVIEMFPEHPWSSLREAYRHFHQLDRPEGPTVDDLLEVVRELGHAPLVERWIRPSDIVYETVEELVAASARRLVLPPTRWAELAEYVKPQIVGIPGNYRVGPDEREIFTVWWTTAPA